MLLGKRCLKKFGLLPNQYSLKSFYAPFVLGFRYGFLLSVIILDHLFLSTANPNRIVEDNTVHCLSYLIQNIAQILVHLLKISLKNTSYIFFCNVLDASFFFFLMAISEVPFIFVQSFQEHVTCRGESSMRLQRPKVSTLPLYVAKYHTFFKVKVWHGTYFPNVGSLLCSILKLNVKIRMLI